jgi:hypothetical protein
LNKPVEVIQADNEPSSDLDLTQFTDEEKRIADEVHNTMLALEVRILTALLSGGTFNIRADSNNRQGLDTFTLTITKKERPTRICHRVI